MLCAELFELLGAGSITLVKGTHKLVKLLVHMSLFSAKLYLTLLPTF